MSLRPKQHRDRFGRFAELTAVTNTDGQTNTTLQY